MKILTPSGWKQLDETKVHDAMAKQFANIKPELVRRAAAHVEAMAGDHVYNGDDWDDRLSHSKNLDRAQAKGMMVPGRDHVVHAHAEIAAEHLHKLFGHRPGFDHNLVYNAAVDAGKKIWGHDEPEASDKWQKYKDLDAKRAAERKNKPKKIRIKKYVAPKKPTRTGTGSYGHVPGAKLTHTSPYAWGPKGLKEAVDHRAMSMRIASGKHTPEDVKEVERIASKMNSNWKSVTPKERSVHDEALKTVRNAKMGKMLSGKNFKTAFDHIKF